MVDHRLSSPVVSRPRPRLMARAQEDPVLWALLSPVNIMIIMWLIGFLAYLYASAARSELLYLRFMAAAENLREGATALSFVWLFGAFAAFVIGTWLAPRSLGLRSLTSGWSDAKATRALIAAFLFVASIAFLWLGVTVVKIGPGQLMALAASDNVSAREVALSGAFPGGRLISNGGFMALSVFSAMMLALPRRVPLSGPTKITILAIFLVSLTYLGLVPILMAGRINFFAAIIASYVAACIAKRRIYGVIYLPVAAVLLIAVWTAKQYFTLGHVLNVSIFDQSFQGIIFYFYNDMLNSTNVIGNLGDNYQWGYNSFRFLFFFTFTDEWIWKITSTSRYYLMPFIGGGEYPLLTAPYVDFGVLGLGILVVLGAFCQFVYRSAKMNPVVGALFGIVFAGLIMSVHSAYLTLQDPVFAMIAISALLFLSVQRRAK